MAKAAFLKCLIAASQTRYMMGCSEGASYKLFFNDWTGVIARYKLGLDPTVHELKIFARDHIEGLAENLVTVWLPFGGLEYAVLENPQGGQSPKQILIDEVIRLQDSKKIGSCGKIS